MTKQPIEMQIRVIETKTVFGGGKPSKYRFVVEQYVGGKWVEIQIIKKVRNTPTSG